MIAALPRPAAPEAMFALQLPLPPERLWPRLLQGDVLGPCLGLTLPADALVCGRRTEGRDAAQRPVGVHLLALHPPQALSLAIDGNGPRQLVHLTLEERGQGSRVVLQRLSQPIGDPMGNAADGPVDRPARPEAEPSAVASTFIQAHGEADAALAPDRQLIALLTAAPSATLLNGRIGSAVALAQARDYLADSAAAMQQLLVLLPAERGYAKPFADRFSLVEQVWHLADIETFGWSLRLPRALRETRPVLPGVDGDALALERRYQLRPWRGAARRFLARRRQSLAALARFDVATLARPLHFSGRDVDVGALLAAMVAHDHEHRLEMAALWQHESSTAMEAT